MSSANPYAPPSAPVSEEPSAGALLPAGRGARLAASLLDALLLSSAMLPSMLGMRLQVFAGRVPAAALGDMASLAVALLLAGAFVVQLQLSGQTPGKAALGIGIVRTGGGRASLPRLLLLRVMPTCALAVLPHVGALGLLADSLLILLPSRRCLHDYIADTRVVKV